MTSKNEDKEDLTEKKQSLIQWLAKDLIDRFPPEPPKDYDIEKLKKRFKILKKKGVKNE